MYSEDEEDVFEMSPSRDSEEEEEFRRKSKNNLGSEILSLKIEITSMNIKLVEEINKIGKLQLLMEQMKLEVLRRRNEALEKLLGRKI